MTGAIMIPQVPLAVAVAVAAAVPPIGFYSQCRRVVTFAVSAVQEGTTRAVQAQPPRRGGAHGTATPPAGIRGCSSHPGPPDHRISARAAARGHTRDSALVSSTCSPPRIVGPAALARGTRDLT